MPQETEVLKSPYIQYTNQEETEESYLAPVPITPEHFLRAIVILAYGTALSVKTREQVTGIFLSCFYLQLSDHTK